VAPKNARRIEVLCNEWWCVDALSIPSVEGLALDISQALAGGLPEDAAMEKLERPT
jgi:hypothetical protein